MAVREQQLVNDANKGVVADLGGVTARAIVIQPRSLKPTKPHNYAHNNAWVLTRTVAIAESMARQSGIARALGTAGNITTNREAGNAMLSNNMG